MASNKRLMKVNVDTQVYAKLASKADKDGRSVSNVVNWALGQWIDSAEREEAEGVEPEVEEPEDA